jgi:hypothetical protein
VDVGIHEPRDDRAPAEVDHLGVRVGTLADVLVGAGFEHLAVADGDALRHRGPAVEGDHLAVHEDSVGALRVNGGGGGGERGDQHE